jgi:transcriptional regulator with XRE-family HTH domain
MYVAVRLRKLREAKHLSQGEIEKRTGLLRCYISRVENGATVPSIDTLQKIVNALEMPLYQFFYEEDDTPPMKPWFLPNGEMDWSSGRQGRRYFVQLTHALSTMTERDKKVLMATALQMARRSHRNGQ